MAQNVPQIQYHTVQCDTVEFRVPIRYQELERIGQGRFGCVARARDTKTKQLVAIKKMSKAFENDVIAKRSYRELKILSYLNHPDGQIAQLLNIFTPDSDIDHFQTLYFVMNYVDYDLQRLFDSIGNLNEEQIQLLTYSLLRAFKYIHSAKIMHRDLKPANIGISTNFDVTILDFGLARANTGIDHTGYVETRWWRAPEVLINWEHYDDKIDIWAVGCIMAGLILRKTIFNGRHHLNQLEKILRVIGTAGLEIPPNCPSVVSNYLLGLGYIPKQNFDELFGYKYAEDRIIVTSGVSPAGVDLLDRLLSLNPNQRPTAEQALEHPYFESYHDLEDEPSAPEFVDPNENAKYTAEQWKQIIWNMIQTFQPPTSITNHPN